MRLRVAISFFLCLSILQLPLSGRQPIPPPVPLGMQAVTILQQSVSSLGSLPSDSTALGSVSLVAGSDAQVGSIQIQTRGTDQSLEQLTTQDGTKQTVFSRGYASALNNAGSRSKYSFELAASTQSALFPLPLLSGILASPDSAYQLIGSETLDGTLCQHIRTWNTYASQPDQQFLAPFTVRDTWIDAKTNLPVKIAYSLRAGSGAVPSIAVEVTFSDYRAISGVLYPFQISESLNGTSWLSITISSVSFNTGLTDSTFSIQ